MLIWLFLSVCIQIGEMELWTTAKHEKCKWKLYRLISRFHHYYRFALSSQLIVQPIYSLFTFVSYYIHSILYGCYFNFFPCFCVLTIALLWLAVYFIWDFKLILFSVLLYLLGALSLFVHLFWIITSRRPFINTAVEFGAFCWENWKSKRSIRISGSVIRLFGIIFWSSWKLNYFNELIVWFLDSSFFTWSRFQIFLYLSNYK